MDFECTYVRRITKICKFERKLDSFTPSFRKRREGLNEKIPPDVTAHPIHRSSKLLLRYYFGENNLLCEISVR